MGIEFWGSLMFSIAIVVASPALVWLLHDYEDYCERPSDDI